MDGPPDKPLPNEVETEAILLWALVVCWDMPVAKRALKGLWPEDFYNERHSWLFARLKNWKGEMDLKKLIGGKQQRWFAQEIAIPGLESWFYWWNVPWMVKRIKVASKKRHGILQAETKLREAWKA